MVDPVAIAFANTRSSVGRDRIATLEPFREWATAWPALTGLLRTMDSAAMPEICALRDATQLVLHQLADGRRPPEQPLRLATRRGLAAAPFGLRPAEGIIVADVGSADAVAHLLSRAVVDFLLGPQTRGLRRCQGKDCWKVFIAHRSDRRWCDSRVCGNRARVAAHTGRRK
jgi:predicted RNA-binding Zn ribbon-like protein